MALLEEIIDRTEFVKRLYGSVPNLKKLSVFEVHLEQWDRLKIAVVVEDTIATLPRKWRDSNATSCQLVFFGIDKISLNYNLNSVDRSFFSVTKSAQNYACNIEGQLNAQFEFATVYFDKISPTHVPLGEH